MTRGCGRGALLVLSALAVLSVSLLYGCGAGAKRKTAPSRESPLGGAPTTPALSYAAGSKVRRPNIVFVLTDDLSRDLVAFMPQVQALRTRGLTFDNYIVSDSLCCPSRASILTGNFPHDTGVLGNTPNVGGFATFHERGDEAVAFNVALQHSGYATAMMGKYLNGYLEPGQDSVAPSYIPPGWSEWDVAGFGYPEFNYAININGTIREFGHRPRDYLTDVIAGRGVDFIHRMANRHRPFFLELATFAPHRPYTPAPHDAHDFPGLGAPEPPNFDVTPTHPPRWLAGHPPLDARKLRLINRAFRKRAQSVQSIDRMISRIEAALDANHLTGDTYIVFSSDNGLHTGEYRLTPGKLTAFDTDIRVPLVVAGPGVPINRRTELFAQNIDLAKTFEVLAGAPPTPDDGISLVPILRGRTPPNWQNAALIEHHGPANDARDPDRQNHDTGNPPTYEAMRTGDFLYVEYIDGEREFYNLRVDPFELHNLAGKLTAGQLTTLHAALGRLTQCHNGAACQAAAHVPPLTHAPT